MHPPTLTRATRWAPWLAAGAAVVAISIGGTLAGQSRQGSIPIDARGVGLIVVAGAVVAVVRRWPTAAFAVALLATVTYLVVGFPSDSPYLLGLLVTAYLAPAADARRRSLSLAIAAVGILAVSALIAPTIIAALAALAALVLAALGAGQVAAEVSARGERRAADSREQEARSRLAEERLAIARDLHDVVSHSIALINVQAAVAVHVMEERPEQAREALLTIKSTSHQALEGLREILGLLRDDEEGPARVPSPRLADLPALLDEIRAAGVTVEVDARLPESMPVTADMVGYRVVSEALTNVVRHAPGATARVTLEARDRRLMIEVADDGPTAAAPSILQGAGQGLRGLRERVHAVGGELSARRGTHRGFVVTAWLPLPESAS